jgi:predicted ATPase/class 3 adenylate cyclase
VSTQRTTSQPTGDVTFLFTDIEGSTQRWESHSAAMPAAVALHDALVRSAIERHHGFVFKTVGDAFCAAFSDPVDAIAAAIDAQRDLAQQDWSAIGGLWVRMGLHSGDGSLRDGDYFGPHVNRVARLMSVGHGGQVLISDVTAERVGAALPAGVDLGDLGTHRLKDLVAPMRIHELRASFLAADHPPLRSLDARPNNLPVRLTTLIGREQDIDAVGQALTESRIVTLTGAGGVGKTRLALQIGAEVLDRYPDGVWFIDLAPLGDSRLVPSAVAAAVGVRDTGTRELMDSIVGALRHHRALIILDNCEHVIEEAARLADAVVRTCAKCAILATSRELLRIPGEFVYRVASLETTAAAALFAERAIAADRSFALSEDNVRAVTEVCRRLDGIPLAIELAAARVRVMTPAQLVKNLSDHFRVLGHGSRTALPRQQTLHALIDWSHNLLSDGERAIFRRLAAFSGGWTTEAAQDVCAAEGIGEWEVLDALAALVDKSLVVPETSETDARYRLLETTRAFAGERLTESGERERIASAHARWFTAYAQRRNEEWCRTPSSAWAATLVPEIDNFRGAFEWAVMRRNDVLIGARLAGALFWFFRDQGMPVEGYRWARESLDAFCARGVAVPADVEAQVHLATAVFGAVAGIGHDQRRTHLKRALDLYTAAGDREGMAWSMHYLGGFYLRSDDQSQAGAIYEEALALSGQLPNMRLRAWCIHDMAGVATDIQVQRELRQKAIALLKSSGDECGLPNLLLSHGGLEDEAGNPELGLELIREGIAMARRRRDKMSLAFCVTGAIHLAFNCGEIEESRRHLREALVLARELSLNSILADCFYEAARIALKSNRDAATAARCIGYGDARLLAAGEKRNYSVEETRRRALAALGKAMDENALEKAMREGAAMNEDEVFTLALNV